MDNAGVRIYKHPYIDVTTTTTILILTPAFAALSICTLLYIALLYFIYFTLFERFRF